ncbi:MAG: hypothetical protein QGD96_03115 [Anaerolineae bacterium]|nr:hypothetical protein [Anaerolineae bacterium]
MGANAEPVIASNIFTGTVANGYINIPAMSGSFIFKRNITPISIEAEIIIKVDNLLLVGFRNLFIWYIYNLDQGMEKSIPPKERG